LAIDVKYDRDTLTTADTLSVTATATNRSAVTAPMVMLDLPIPPGFRVETDDFDKLLGQGIIARYQLTPTQIIIYLRGLEPNKSLTLKYRLRPGDPGVLAVSPARVWEYYNPDREARGGATRLTVTARK